MKYKISRDGRKARRCSWYTEHEDIILGIAISIVVMLSLSLIIHL